MAIESVNHTVEAVNNLNNDIKGLENKLNDIKEKTWLFSEYSPSEGMDKVIDTISDFIKEKYGTINIISNALSNWIENQEVNQILTSLVSKMDILISTLNDNSTWVSGWSKDKFNMLLAELNTVKSKIS